MPKRRPEHQPERTCAVCRAVHPKRAMTRFVRGSDGTVSLDPSGKAPGRGTYVCDQTECRDRKRLAAGIERALGVVITPDGLPAEVTHASA